MGERTLISAENEAVKIRIRYHADIDRVEKISQGDWIDLRATEDVEMKKGQFKMFSLGVSMELPKG